MNNKSKNLVDIHELVSEPYLLDYEEESEFLDWCVLEGSEKISELSRQLRSYLNYKSAVIRFRFSKPREGLKAPKKSLILKFEGELSSLFSRYVTLLKIIGVEKGIIADNIHALMEKVRVKPNDFEIKLLKEIKYIGCEIWKIIHLLSNLEIYHHPQLLNIIIQIACFLCSAQSIFYLPFMEFYQELNLNYKQLEGEIASLLQLNEKNYFELKKDKKRVRILE